MIKSTYLWKAYYLMVKLTSFKYQRKIIGGGGGGGGFFFLTLFFICVCMCMCVYFFKILFRSKDLDMAYETLAVAHWATRQFLRTLRN